MNKSCNDLKHRPLLVQPLIITQCKRYPVHIIKENRTPINYSNVSQAIKTLNRTFINQTVAGNQNLKPLQLGSRRINQAKEIRFKFLLEPSNRKSERRGQMRIQNDEDMTSSLSELIQLDQRINQQAKSLEKDQSRNQPLNPSLPKGSKFKTKENN